MQREKIERDASLIVTREEDHGTQMKREGPWADPLRIVIADDHFLIRQGLRSILKGKDNLQVIGEAGDGIEVLFLVDELNPDLVLLDISMPNLGGIETARLIRMRHPEINILMLTMHQEKEYIVAAASAGIDGYLLKEDAQQDLLLAIEKIRDGKTFISPILVRQLEKGDKPLCGALKFVLDL